METFNISSTDLRDDALDDMMRRIRLDTQDPELLDRESERETEQEQLRWWADHFIHAMSPPSTSTENKRNVSVNPNPDVFQYNTSTPVDQLRPMRPIVNEYNYFNLQNIKAPVPPKWKDNDNFRRF